MYDWLKAEREHGIAGLISKPRNDRGKARVIVSRKWDRMVSFGERKKKEIAGMVPGEVVYGDVHPVDMKFLGPDGTEIRIRLIAWLDHATRRLIGYPMLFAPGRGVRQREIVESFIALTQDPAWSLPETLYLDNGGEYNALSLINDAMAVQTCL